MIYFMRIIELIINLERQSVLARCLYNVQDVEHPITFTLKEADLYSFASDAGRDSWDNQDVIGLALRQLGVHVTA
jgi:hypothetical protein